jgi:hypothetical protein
MSRRVWRNLVDYGSFERRLVLCCLVDAAWLSYCIVSICATARVTVLREVIYPLLWLYTQI